MRPAAGTDRARLDEVGNAHPFWALGYASWGNTPTTATTQGLCHPCRRLGPAPKCCRGRSVGMSDAVREKFGASHTRVPEHIRSPSPRWRWVEQCSQFPHLDRRIERKLAGRCWQEKLRWLEPSSCCSPYLRCFGAQPRVSSLLHFVRLHLLSQIVKGKRDKCDADHTSSDFYGSFT